MDLERLVAFAWDVIAYPKKDTKDWQSAADRFRREYFAYIDAKRSV